MKRIVLIYVFAPLLCLMVGAAGYLIYHSHLWYVTVLSVIALCSLLVIARVMMSEFFMRIDEKNLGKTTVLAVISFLILVGLLMVAGYYGLDLKTFWGTTCAIGVICHIIGLFIVTRSLIKRWEEKKRGSNKYLYWNKIGIVLMPIFFDCLK